MATPELPRGSSDVHASIEAASSRFPRCELSLRPLLRFWAEGFGDDASPRSAVARVIREQINRVPELLEPLVDRTVLDRHRDLLSVVMAAAFPPAFFDQEYAAAMAPFALRSFYATPPFRALLMAEDGHLRGRANVDEEVVELIRVLNAYRLILERVYSTALDVDYPLILTVTDPETGLDRHFKPLFDRRFADVEVIGDAPPLTDEVLRQLRASVLERERLFELLPPDRFVIRGFTIFRAIDVTDQEVVSSIKRDLIERESIVSTASFNALEQKLRVLFRRPELRFGLGAVEGEQVFVLNCSAHIQHSCIFADSVHHRTAEFEGTAFERAVVSGKPVIVEDVAAVSARKPIEEELLQSGIRSSIIAPLHYQDRVIGTLNLHSPKPGDLDGTLLPKLQEVLPLFSMAVQRSMEELDNRIEALMKQRFTAIHPAVEWRFRRAVLQGIERERAGAGVPGEIEPIVFENVHPLYALSDIRGSSDARAHATQADVLGQLRLGRKVVEAARKARSLPALDELLYRIDRHLAQVEQGLGSSDEVAVVTFIRGDVERLFEHVARFAPDVRERVTAYRAALDPQRRVVYRHRQRFEESVSRLTEAISSYVDLEEQAAQEMFPHYFEKRQTDGVDYQIYVGASLVEDGTFDPLYLKNLRLWQLMVTCGVAARAEQLRAQLPVALETTHLVLVQHTPLAIRFRFDEKRFDVDGAYDIRYEIVKKRIDKAVARGSGERITQPGRIAIVYAQAAEAAEYRRYITYLQSLGYLKREVEELELDELQGVHGLRALRVAVDLSNPRVDAPVAEVYLARR